MEHTYDSAEAALRDAIKAGDAEMILALGIVVDELSPKRPPVAFGAAALWYAEQGLRVFPLQPGTKIPYAGTHGCLDATENRAQVIDWWTENPDANVAIATGHIVDVIDIDGPIGVQAWAQHIGQIPDPIGLVSTPREGGNHHYIPATGGGNKANLMPGIDTRGKGGYVVAPPSIVDGKRYTWYRPLDLSGVAR